jgi:UDP-glucuronate 4-epimerase
MTETYVHLHELRATGLRYFTVYGPWGRPDMSPFIFARRSMTARRSTSITWAS